MSDTLTHEQDEYTTGELARMWGAHLWQVRRLFEDRLLPEPKRRVGRYRLIPAADLPKVKAALVKRGYIAADDAPLAPTMPA
jgi:hypothetical protein